MSDTPAPSKSRRGFASMTPERQRDIARRGGQAAHIAGTAHEWTATTAAVAGRKGGLTSSADRDRMRELGRRGGEQRAANAAARRNNPSGAV